MVFNSSIFLERMVGRGILVGERVEKREYIVKIILRIVRIDKLVGFSWWVVFGCRYVVGIVLIYYLI